MTLLLAAQAPHPDAPIVTADPLIRCSDVGIVWVGHG